MNIPLKHRFCIEWLPETVRLDPPLTYPPTLFTHPCAAFLTRSYSNARSPTEDGVSPSSQLIDDDFHFLFHEEVVLWSDGCQVDVGGVDFLFHHLL